MNLLLFSFGKFRPESLLTSLLGFKPALSPKCLLYIDVLTLLIFSFLFLLLKLNCSSIQNKDRLDDEDTTAQTLISNTGNNENDKGQITYMSDHQSYLCFLEDNISCTKLINGPFLTSHLRCWLLIILPASILSIIVINMAPFRNNAARSSYFLLITVIRTATRLLSRS